MSAFERRQKGKWAFKEFPALDLTTLAIGPINAVVKNGCTQAEASIDASYGTVTARAYFNGRGFLAIEYRGIRRGEEMAENNEMPRKGK
jgi:hypothetical protein